MLVPSVGFWIRDEFLRARRLQYEASPDTVLRPNDKIVCDLCDHEVTETIINLVEFGKRVACERCYTDKYLGLPRTYRKLNEDGTLGDLIDED